MNAFRALQLMSLALVALSTACGGGSNSDLPAADPVPSPAPSPSPSPAPAPAPSPAPGVPPLAVTPVGSALGPVAASAVIGPAGGRVDAPDYGLAVIVPAGAFDREHTVALQPIESRAPGARGSAWRITPEGVTAAKPITLAWNPSVMQRMGTTGLRIASQGADGVWRSVAAQPDVDGIVRTTATHFSDWSLVAGVQLRPPQADVELGKSLELEVQVCQATPDPARPGLLQHHVCGNPADFALGTGTWAVNGVPAGNAALGVVRTPSALDPARASYTAPTSLPSTNPVSVSVPYKDVTQSGSPTELLVAHVNVIDPMAGCDWVRSVAEMDLTVEIDWRWSGHDGMRRAEFSDTVRASGRLRAPALQIIGQAFFGGRLEQGQVKVERYTVWDLTGETVRVSGNGPLAQPSGGDSVTAVVDLVDCRLILGLTAQTQGQRVATSSQGSSTTTVTAGLGLAMADFQLGGLRQWSQDRLLPVRLSAEGELARVTPDGAGDPFESTMGTARVRWSLTPR